LAPHQKKARRRGAEIIFVDETGFSFRAKTGTTWAPRGQTPVLRRMSKRRELSTVIGLTLSGKIYKRHFEHAIGAGEILEALRHFQRHLPGPMIIIWDRLNAHRAVIVKEYMAAHPAMTVEWLPPYAPDLNPEEGCHGNIKQHLRNAAPLNSSDLRTQVDRGFARLRRRPDLILGFFRHAGLDVNQLW
jgi:transposase